MTGARNLNFYHMENKSWKKSKLNRWNHLPRKRVSGWELVVNELNGRISDRWRTRSDNVFSAKSKGNERKGVGFYRWSARKTKRHFDPRYKPIDEWHVLYALNASGSLLDLCTPDGLILHKPSSKDPRHHQLESSDRHLVDCDTVHSIFTVII